MITKDMKVSKMLRDYPETMEVLLKASPHFNKLKNKLHRKTLAPRVNIEQASSIILFTYWTMTISTLLRFIFQIISAFVFADYIGIGITVFSVFQVTAIILFFYAMWGRIRAVGSQYREAKGERF